MGTINPYLTFSGNCEDAFNFYRSIFGGEFDTVSKFKDMPPDPKYPVSDDMKDRIMHISLPISKETILMGSDSSDSFGHATIMGNNITLSYNTRDVDDVKRVFEQLAEGGQIKMALDKTFWGAYFGMCTDKFGIHWMVNCELEEHKEYVKDRDGDAKTKKNVEDYNAKK